MLTATADSAADNATVRKMEKVINYMKLVSAQEVYMREFAHIFFCSILIQDYYL